MEPLDNIIQIIRDVVLHPSVASALSLFWISIVNELVALFPYAFILSSQLVFLHSFISTAILAKLFIFVAIPVGVGSAIGSFPIYWLTYFGGKPAIEKFGKYFRLSWQDIEKMESKFDGTWYDEIIFLVLRSVPVAPSLPVSAVAGILRMRFWSYFLFSSLGFTIRMMIMFVLVGLGVITLAI